MHSDGTVTARASVCELRSVAGDVGHVAAELATESVCEETGGATLMISVL